MSYVRVNESSDSEDDAVDAGPNSHVHPNRPSASTSRTSRNARNGGLAAGTTSIASLAGLQPGGYRQLDDSGSSDDDKNAFGGETPRDASTKKQKTDMQASGTKEESITEAVALQPPEDRDYLEIHFRFGEGLDLDLRVPRMDSIAQLKDRIKAARPALSEKHLRLIHAGKILADEAKLIDSLPRSLFKQVPVKSTEPGQQYHSRLSSSVEAVEAVAQNILAGITASARSAGEKAISSTPTPAPSTQPPVRASTSHGSVLPTHVSFETGSSEMEQRRQHVTIEMPPSDSETTSNTKSPRRQASTATIPIQTGPIYILCSISDYAPSKPTSSSTAKKGKAVVRRASVLGRRSLVAGASASTSSLAAGSSRNRGISEADGSQSSPSGAASSPLALPRRDRVTGSVQIGEGEEFEEGPEEGSDEDLPSPVMAPQPTGFDRLREAGFSEEEVRSIRRQFHATHGTTTVGENGLTTSLDDGDEDAAARARRIEEEWIDQHGAETLPEGLEGSYGEMVLGLILGFFMGLIVLFWLREATFSRRQQMGIIAGLIINLVFGAMRLYY